MFWLYIAAILISIVIVVLYDGYLSRMYDQEATRKEQENRRERQ